MIKYYISLKNSAIYYFKSHIWITIFTVAIASVLTFSLIMNLYLKKKYVHFLTQQTYDTQSTLLASIEQNIDVLLKNFIQQGSQICIDPELQTLLNTYITADASNKALASNRLNAKLTQYTYSFRWLYALCIVDANGIVFQADRDNRIKGYVWTNKDVPFLTSLYDDVFTLLENNALPRYTQTSYSLQITSNAPTTFFHFAFPLKGATSFNDVTHALILSVDTSSLSDILDFITKDDTHATVGYIVDHHDLIALHPDSSLLGTSHEEYLSTHDLEHISIPIERLGWSLNISIDENKLFAHIYNLYDNGRHLYLLALFVILSGLFLIIRWILQPVQAMTTSILKVNEGNLEERIPIYGNHEIWQLAKEYNHMLDSLTEMQKQVDAQHQQVLFSLQKQQLAERESLESQINAHFICNTLGVINYEAIESGNHKISSLIKSLSNILRYTLYQTNQTVYLFQEVAWIEQYLFLQKSRFEEVFEYAISVPTELEDWPCLKLMLQPFVENSILHGFQGMESNGRISITGVLSDTNLNLIIEDNGHGMDSVTAHSINQVLQNPLSIKNEALGIGISNVIARMRMYYGAYFTATLETTPNLGTKFTFLIPSVNVQNKQEECI